MSKYCLFSIILGNFLVISIESGPVDPFPFGLDDRPDPFSRNAGLVRESRDGSETSNRASKHRPKPAFTREPVQVPADNFNQHNTWGFEQEEEEPSTSAPRTPAQNNRQHVMNENEKILLQRYRSSYKKKKTERIQTTTVDPAEDLKSAIRDAQLGITTTDLPPDPRHNGALKDIGSIGVGFGVGVGVPGNDPVSVGTGVSVGLDESGPAGRLPPFTETIFPRQGEQQSLNDYDGNKDLIVSGKAMKYIQAVNLGFIQLPKYAPPKSLVGVNSGIGVLGAQAPAGG